MPLPGYHPKDFPYYVAKTMRSLNLLDFRLNQVWIINELKDIPVDCFAYKKMTVTRTSDSRTKICFVTSDQTAQNTVVDEVILGANFTEAL